MPLPTQPRARVALKARLHHAVLGCASALLVLAGGRIDSAELPGITQAILDATLTTPVAGIITRLRFHEGDFVKEGEIIVDLDKKLEELEVARRQAALDNIATVLKRTEDLVSRTKSVSLEELEKQRSEHRIAQAELDFAREQLRRREIRAPFSGVVASFFGLDPGEGCQPQTPMIRFVDVRQCLFIGNAEARAAQRLKVGQKVPIHLDTREGPRDVEAEVRFISPIADPASGLVEIKAVFDNSVVRVAAGVAANARLPE